MTALSIVGMYLFVPVGASNSKVPGQPEPAIRGAAPADRLTGALLLQPESLVPGRVDPVICNRHSGCVRRGGAQPPEAETECVAREIGFARHGHISLFRLRFVSGADLPRPDLIPGWVSRYQAACRQPGAK